MADPLPFTDDERGSCRSCPDAAVVWALTAVARKPVLVNAEPLESGALVLERIDGELIAFNPSLFDGVVDYFDPHFATCPDADRYRKPRPKGTDQ